MAGDGQERFQSLIIVMNHLAVIDVELKLRLGPSGPR